MNCKGKLIDLTSPKVMGILNITPNSFYDGGSYKNEKELLHRVEKMLMEGADFIDVGAYSSKPNAEFVSEEEEISRITPVVKLLQKEFEGVILSIDTFRAEVAKVCIENGAAIINDISGGLLDPNMLQTIAQYQVPYIMMHMKGTPQNMQDFTQYEDMLKEILFYFSERIAQARAFGINDLIVDPGFGFSKTLEQNFELMKKLDLLKILEFPLLVGISRKSMIYRTLDTVAESALNGTTFLNAMALDRGAKILRVHDVKEAVECVRLFNKMNSK